MFCASYRKGLLLVCRPLMWNDCRNFTKLNRKAPGIFCCCTLSLEQAVNAVTFADDYLKTTFKIRPSNTVDIADWVSVNLYIIP